MDAPEVVPIPEAVTRLWGCVQRALAANEDPSPGDIDRLAASLGLKVAATTIEGWFRTWSVVPARDKFETLIKALGAEHDEDWRSLYRAALTADRERKRQERQRKKQGRAAAPVSSEAMVIEGQPDPHNRAMLETCG